MQKIPFVPDLKMALNTPKIIFEDKIFEHQIEIEKWFRHQWIQSPAPFSTSVDLRNAGFKLAPVDTNLFPAGFNNLSIDSDTTIIYALQVAIERYCPEASKILIIIENHTRNLGYLESVVRLRDLLTKAGFAVRISNLSGSLESDERRLPSGKSLTIHPLVRQGDRVGIKDFIPCSVILNNDLSSGTPAILEGVTQHLLPPLALGWHFRTKSQHFAEYQDVTEEFAKLIGIDPWLLAPRQSVTKGVNFQTGEGVEELVKHVDKLLQSTQQKYDQYRIKQSPYVVVKANSGTYGMGVITVKNSDEIRQLNRKQRNKMKTGKEGINIDELLVQEGVPTDEFVGEDKNVCEPVVYMIDHYVIGGFYRIHQAKAVDENLNSPGMFFQPLAFNQCVSKSLNRNPEDLVNFRFYTYGVIARLALLAAAREVSKQHPKEVN